MPHSFDSNTKRFAQTFHTKSGLHGQILKGGRRYIGGTHDAGDLPILVEKRQTERAGIRLTGLINCVGLIVEITEPGRGVCAMVGGHFVTPEMAVFTYTIEKKLIGSKKMEIDCKIPKSATFTQKGKNFLDAVNELIADVQNQYLAVKCYISYNQGISQPEMEAKVAADAILKSLNLRGSFIKGNSTVNVSF